MSSFFLIHEKLCVCGCVCIYAAGEVLQRIEFYMCEDVLQKVFLLFYCKKALEFAQG